MFGLAWTTIASLAIAVVSFAGMVRASRIEQEGSAPTGWSFATVGWTLLAVTLAQRDGLFGP